MISRFLYKVLKLSVAVVSLVLLLALIGQKPEYTKYVELLLFKIITAYGIFIVALFALSPFLMIYHVFSIPAETVIEIGTDIVPPIPRPQVMSVLTKYFHYYNYLNVTLKERFVGRVEVFLASKSFIGREMKMTNELKILISATAVQLTFGLPSFKILSFRTILVYPETYYSQIRNNFHKGEVNLKRRLIVLSASNYLNGLADPNDGINLGLHELSHALSLNHLIRKRDFSFLHRLTEWETIAEKEMMLIKNNDKHFLRKYASNNIQEMLAVGTESFFEQPNEFKSNLPEFYEKFKELYQQDPINKENPLHLHH